MFICFAVVASRPSYVIICFVCQVYDNYECLPSSSSRFSRLKDIFEYI